MRGSALGIAALAGVLLACACSAPAPDGSELPRTVANIAKPTADPTVDLAPAVREIVPIPAPLNLTQQERDFVISMEKAYPELQELSPRTIVRGGKAACRHFQGGGTVDELANTILKNGHPDKTRTYYVLAYGTHEFCPKYTHEIEELALWL